MSTNNPDIQVLDISTASYNTLTTNAEKLAHYQAEKAVVLAAIGSGIIQKGQDVSLHNRNAQLDTLIALNTPE